MIFYTPGKGRPAEWFGLLQSATSSLDGDKSCTLDLVQVWGTCTLLEYFWVLLNIELLPQHLFDIIMTSRCGQYLYPTIHTLTVSATLSLCILCLFVVIFFVLFLWLFFGKLLLRPNFLDLFYSYRKIVLSNCLSQQLWFIYVYRFKRFDSSHKVQRKANPIRAAELSGAGMFSFQEKQCQKSENKSQSAKTRSRKKLYACDLKIKLFLYVKTAAGIVLTLSQGTQCSCTEAVVSVSFSLN